MWENSAQTDHFGETFLWYNKGNILISQIYTCHVIHNAGGEEHHFHGDNDRAMFTAGNELSSARWGRQTMNVGSNAKSFADFQLRGKVFLYLSKKMQT